MPVLYLRPGSDAAQAVSISADPLALGSVIVVPASGWAPALDLPVLSVTLTASPWAPLSILADTTLPEDFPAVMQLILPGTCKSWIAVPPPQHSDSFTAAAAIRKAIADRPLPDHEAFCCYLRRRLPSDVVDCIAKVLRHPASRTERRRLQQAGTLPPRAWVALLEVVHAIATSIRAGGSEEQAADVIHRTSRTLSRRVHELLGTNWRTAVDYDCWEAVIEQALRARSREMSLERESPNRRELVNK
jgi:hypothetical protein